MSRSSSAKRPTELIASTTVVGGSMKTPHHVRIRGTVNGRVEAAGTVMVEAGACVEEGISASKADISGKVLGDIRVPEGKVILRSTAVVEGDVSAAQLIVANGACLQGVCRTTRSTGDSSPTENDPFLRTSVAAA